MKKTKIDALFDSTSQENVIEIEVVNYFGLEFHDNLKPIYIRMGK